MGEADLGFRRLLARAWSAGEGAGLPLHFRAAVLDRYRAQPGVKILRTDTVGRLLVPGRALLDFGIVDQDRRIHLRFGDLLRLLPESERDHWLEYLEPPALSRAFVQMQLNPSSCYDDGPIREWPAEAPRAIG